MNRGTEQPKSRVIPCLCGACGGNLMIIPQCDYCSEMAVGMLHSGDNTQVCEKHKNEAHSQGIF